MADNNILISIIIPSYNRAYTIGRTIDSFIAQDYDNWEMLVVDDHSTDNTSELIADYERKDPRIHYLLNERKKGAQGARNTGILHAKADWVVLFDSDDVAYPNYLSVMASHIDESCDVITCNAEVVNIDTNERQLARWGAEGDDVESKLLNEMNYVNFIDSLFRKGKLVEIGLLAEDCPAFQEYDTHIRVSRISTYKQIQDVLLDYYSGGKDTISYDCKKNRGGLVWVVWHNRERWRKVAYKHMVSMAKRLFRNQHRKYRWLLIKAVPEVVLMIPIIYLNVLIRKINLKCKINIPQL